MQLNGYSLAHHEPGDEQEGGWTREQLLDMDSRFTAALERAFELGLESRASAASRVNLPASHGPHVVGSEAVAFAIAQYRQRPTQLDYDEAERLLRSVLRDRRQDASTIDVSAMIGGAAKSNNLLD